MQQSLAERGLAPAPAPDDIVTAEPEIVAEPDAETEPAPEADAQAAQSPMIDARVEADGSTILAGTVDPNIDVHLFFDGVEVGQTTSDSAGDWVYIPDGPLPIGGIAITLGTSVEGEEIAQGSEALAVVVDGENQPTVVAAAPDELAGVISELTGTPPDLATGDEQPMEMAAIEPEDVPEADDPATTLPDADLVAPEPEAVEETPDAVADEPEPVEEPAPVEESAPVEDLVPVEEPAEPAAAETPESPDPEDDAPMEMAAVEPDQIVPDEPVTGVPPAISVEPTIDAVEIEPEGSFIAGAGEEGAIIRLFVDDEFVGESRVDGGRWLVETDDALTEPSQRIRAEMVSPDDIVTAEAEINFVIEQPEIESPAADADLILPADQLAPIALPTEAPLVVADAPEAVQADEPDQDLILSDESLTDMSLPDEAPAITIAEVENAPDAESSPMDVAEAISPDEAFILPDDQLVPIALATEAPSIEVPADTTEPMEMADASEDALVLPDDQLVPIELPTEAPTIDAPVEPVMAEAETVAEADPFILPDDQLPAIELPSVAPSIELDEPVAEEPMVAETEDAAPVEMETPTADMAEETIPETEVAEVEPETVTLPADQLPVIELPTDAPVVPVVEVPEPVEAAEAPVAVAEAPTPAPAPLRLPADQLPEIELPTVAPPVDLAEAEPAEVPDAETVGEPEMAEAETTEVEAEAETEAEMPTLVATPVGDPGEGRFASGNVIIRRGDNLWTIARRVYGRGIQYTRIFDANREKINNPNLIFPGQVFELPASTQE